MVDFKFEHVLLNSHVSIYNVFADGVFDHATFQYFSNDDFCRIVKVVRVYADGSVDQIGSVAEYDEV